MTATDSRADSRTDPPGARTAVRPAGYGLIRVKGGGRSGHDVRDLRGGSFLLHRRSALVALGLALATVAVCVAYLCVGESFVAPADAVRTVLHTQWGLGQATPNDLVVGTLRLPRMTLGLMVGAAFGTAGALIQTVARNPLASPDIIGVSQGASAVTVGAMTYGVTSFAVLPYLSVAGGLAAAALVYVFAWRGGLQATRFVLIGIGFAVALRSITHLFLTKGDYLVAQQAKVWMTGSLNGRGWDEAGPLGWALLVLLPGVLWAARAQRTVSLDDDTATALGVRLGRVRLGLVSLGVVLASMATGAAGLGGLRGAARPADRPPDDQDRPDPAAVLGPGRSVHRRHRRSAGPQAVRADRTAGGRADRRGRRPVSDPPAAVFRGTRP